LQPRAGDDRAGLFTACAERMGAGFKGETIVVASADTGVRWTHNALKPHYELDDERNT